MIDCKAEDEIPKSVQKTLDLPTSAAELINQCLLSWPEISRREPEARFRSLGRHLQALCELGPAALMGVLREHLFIQKEHFNLHFQALLEERRGAPAYWAKDV